MLQIGKIFHMVNFCIYKMWNRDFASVGYILSQRSIVPYLKNENDTYLEVLVRSLIFTLFWGEISSDIGPNKPIGVGLLYP